VQELGRAEQARKAIAGTALLIRVIIVRLQGLTACNGITDGRRTWRTQVFLNSNRPDEVLDLAMPDMDGVEGVRYLAARKERPPIAIL
jgi:CheY-like chemotaxis protein